MPPPEGRDLDLQDPKEVCDLFQEAAALNLNSAGRQGAVVDLGTDNEVETDTSERETP